MEIPCSETPLQLVNNDFQVSQSIDTLNFLSSYLSPSKILARSPEARQEFSASIASALPDCNERLNIFKDLTHCVACKEAPFEILVSCNHGYCKPCLQQHIERLTSSKIVLNKHESSEEGLISARCIKCSLGFSIKDLSLVFENTEELELNAKLRAIAVDCDRNGSFECITCEKIRGKDMLSQNSCRHMCKICIAQHISTKNSMNCKVCSKNMNSAELTRETKPCCKCGINKYFVGDYMQEVCPGFLYCVNCTVEVLEHSKCSCHNMSISDRDKVYLYSNFLKVCEKCKNEKFCLSFLRHSCCGFNICYACAGQGENCFGCAKPLTLTHKTKISEHNSRSMRNSRIF